MVTELELGCTDTFHIDRVEVDICFCHAYRVRVDTIDHIDRVSVVICFWHVYRVRVNTSFVT